jgi:hypothetical protein
MLCKCFIIDHQNINAMKKIILISILIFCLISLKGQISMTADSAIYCKSGEIQENFTVVNRLAEKFSLEIDKDLLTLRIFGKGHEHAFIEVAYIIDLLDVDKNQEKWLFQGEDKNCNSYTITLNVITKRIELITFKKDDKNNKTMTMTYYPIVDIQINKDAIFKHLEEKLNNKL